MKRYFTTKVIAGLGVLTAMVVVLQLIGNYVQFGPVSISLALFPIAIGAMLYGPIGGAFLGLVDGALVLTAPSTISFFFAITPLGTIITCLGKTTIAGLVAGFIFKLYKAKYNVGLLTGLLLIPLVIAVGTPELYGESLKAISWSPVMMSILKFVILATLALIILKSIFKPSESSVIILSSISVPLVNTGLFLVCALTFFAPKIVPMANDAGQNIVYFILFTFIGWNFLLEFAVNAFLASSFHNAYKTLEKNFAKRG